MADRREDIADNPRAYRNRRLGMFVLLAILLAVPVGVTLWDDLTGETMAPDFTLTDTGYRDGVLGAPETFNLSDFRGQVVVLDFMAVNCASCTFMTDRVVAPLYEVYRDDPRVTILAVDVWAGDAGETNEDLIRLQQEGHIGAPPEPWRHALDTDGVLQKYGTFSIPQLAVVGPDGELVFNQAGIPRYNAVNATVQSALAGDAESVGVVQVGVIGLAFLAGLASFFAPCSVGLIPAYMGFLIQGQQGVRREHVLRHSLGGGLQTAGGIVAIYAVIAALLWAFSDTLSRYLPVLSPIVAVLLIAFGVFMLIGFDWERIAKRLGMGQVDGRKGFFAFGIGYGLAAFGCTGPVFLPILLAGFAQGAGTGLAAFAVYTLAVAAFVVFAAYLVSQGQQTRLRRLLSHTTLVTRVSAALLIGAGAYLLWFDYQAYGWPF